MVEVAIREARDKLDELVEEVTRGEVVVLADDAGRHFQLVPFDKRRTTPTFGFAKGKIKMAADFDEPLDDFADYVP